MFRKFISVYCFVCLFAVYSFFNRAKFNKHHEVHSKTRSHTFELKKNQFNVHPNLTNPKKLINPQRHFQIQTTLHRKFAENAFFSEPQNSAQTPEEGKKKYPESLRPPLKTTPNSSRKFYDYVTRGEVTRCVIPSGRRLQTTSSSRGWVLLEPPVFQRVVISRPSVAMTTP